MLLIPLLTSCNPTRRTLNASPTSLDTESITDSPLINTASMEIRTATVASIDCDSIQHQEDPAGMLLLTKINEGINVDIYLYDINNNHFRRVTENSSRDYMPAITSDGKRLVFISDRNHPRKNGLFFVEVNKTLDPSLTIENVNSLKELVVPTEFVVENPVWSFDNKWVAYVAVYENHSYIDVLNPDSGEGTRVKSNSIWNKYPTWAKDSNDLYILNENENNDYATLIQNISLKEIFENIYSHENILNQNIYGPAGLSLNQRSEILLTIDDQNTSGIYKILPGNSQEIIEVYKKEDEDAWGAIWSPDGEWIAFQVKEKEGNNTSIYIANEKTKEIFKVFTNSQVEAKSITWSPESKLLSYTRKEGKSTYYIDIISINAIIKNIEGCNYIPIEIGPIESNLLKMYSWIM